MYRYQRLTLIKAKLDKMMSKHHDVTLSTTPNQSIRGEKLIYPAANRNKEPILQVLKKVITYDIKGTTKPLFLEVSSGSGQHLSHFAPHFPGINFQPTEVDENLFGSLQYYANNCLTKNILQPVLVDICVTLSEYGFDKNSINYIYNANMMHISPFKCTIGLFKNAGDYLKPNSLMITYGPFGKDGIITPQSNIDFDASLRARDPSWGIRDIRSLIKLGDENGLTLIDTIEMPSNNKTLIWKKK